MVNILAAKLTEIEILERIKQKHGEKYSYKYFGLLGVHEYISIKCNSCGNKFKQKLYAHMGGHGCKKCGRVVGANKKKRTQEEFLALCAKKHGSKYDYSETVYTLSIKKIKIICPVHGAFYQVANNHINGQGCPKCADCAQLDKNEFERRSRLVHGDRYDYSMVDYRNAHEKVKIICLDHGVFEMKPNAHASGKQGCPDCGLKRRSILSTVPFDEFLRRSRKHHGDFYKYDESTYSGSEGEILITCPDHGDFKQRAIDHSRGHGCVKCGRNLNGFGRSNFKNICDRKNNGNGSLYLIKCWNNEELFFKVGITSHKNQKSRFHGKFMPYNYEFLSIVTGDANTIYDLETQIHRLLKSKKYTPTIEFKGMGECFSSIPRKVLNLIKSMDQSEQLILVA